jgi:hypothetical protein
MGTAPEHFEFSALQHAVFLDGYFDAVGRLLTTDAELWALTARDAAGVLDGDLLFGVSVRGRSVVENWSKEFSRLVDELLRIDQRTRLGFYLVEYICWFQHFTRNAECFKLDCEPLRTGTLDQAVYVLQLEGNQRVLLLVQHLDKALVPP